MYEGILMTLNLHALLTGDKRPSDNCLFFGFVRTVARKFRQFLVSTVPQENNHLVPAGIQDGYGKLLQLLQCPF